MRQAFGPILVTGFVNDLGHPRLGLAVAKRHVPKAVNRNFVKRTIREWFRRNQREFVCMDIMVSLRRRVDDAQKVSDALADVADTLKTKG